MNQQFLDATLAGSIADFLHPMALLHGELGHLCPAEAGKVGSDAQLQPEFVGQAPDIGSRRHPAAELDQVTVQTQNRKFLHFHLNRRKLDLLLLAGQFVSWNPLDLLGGKRWRSLLDVADKADATAPISSSVTLTACARPDGSPSQS